MGFIKNGVNRTKHWVRKHHLLNKVRILIFGHDGADCELLRSILLQESSASVDVSPTVVTAVTMHRRTPYHVIIAVIRPGMWAGFELIKAIRETDVEYRGFTVMLAVGFTSEDEQRSIAAGFDVYISSPLDASEVINVIVQRLNDLAKRAA